MGGGERFVSARKLVKCTLHILTDRRKREQHVTRPRRRLARFAHRIILFVMDYLTVTAVEDVWFGDAIKRRVLPPLPGGRDGGTYEIDDRKRIDEIRVSGNLGYP